MTWSATWWRRRRQERVEIPGQVVLEREARLGAGDGVELVGLVARRGGAVAGQIVGAEARDRVGVVLGLAGMHSVQ